MMPKNLPVQVLLKLMVDEDMKPCRQICAQKASCTIGCVMVELQSNVLETE
jgi:hypothetical protein